MGVRFAAGTINVERSPEVVARALAAAKRMRKEANEMKLGLTREDILRWVKEGHR
jgi:hypothetical protein